MQLGTLIPTGDPAPDMVQACLSKIVSSELFSRCVRHRRLLRFTVEETLARRGTNLNEYVLGLEVFDREVSFDPQSDPQVRVGAMRLRAKLKAYYETEGREDSVVIAFPRRGYAPVFRWRSATIEERQKSNDLACFDARGSGVRNGTVAAV